MSSISITLTLAPPIMSEQIVDSVYLGDEPKLPVFDSKPLSYGKNSMMHDRRIYTDFICSNLQELSTKDPILNDEWIPTEKYANTNQFNGHSESLDKAKINDQILQEKLEQAKAMNRGNQDGAIMHTFSLWGGSNSHISKSDTTTTTSTCISPTTLPPVQMSGISMNHDITRLSNKKLTLPSSSSSSLSNKFISITQMNDDIHVQNSLIPMEPITRTQSEPIQRVISPLSMINKQPVLESTLSSIQSISHDDTPNNDYISSSSSQKTLDSDDRGLLIPSLHLHTQSISSSNHHENGINTISESDSIPIDSQVVITMNDISSNSQYHQLSSDNYSLRHTSSDRNKNYKRSHYLNHVKKSASPMRKLSAGHNSPMRDHHRTTSTTTSSSSGKLNNFRDRLRMKTNMLADITSEMIDSNNSSNKSVETDNENENSENNQINTDYNNNNNNNNNNTHRIDVKDYLLNESRDVLSPIHNSIDLIQTGTSNFNQSADRSEEMKNNHMIIKKSGIRKPAVSSNRSMIKSDAYYHQPIYSTSNSNSYSNSSHSAGTTTMINDVSNRLDNMHMYTSSSSIMSPPSSSESITNARGNYNTSGIQIDHFKYPCKYDELDTIIPHNNGGEMHQVTAANFTTTRRIHGNNSDSAITVTSSSSSSGSHTSGRQVIHMNHSRYNDSNAHLYGNDDEQYEYQHVAIKKLERTDPVSSSNSAGMSESSHILNERERPHSEQIQHPSLSAISTTSSNHNTDDYARQQMIHISKSADSIRSHKYQNFPFHGHDVQPLQSTKTYIDHQDTTSAEMSSARTHSTITTNGSDKQNSGLNPAAISMKSSSNRSRTNSNDYYNDFIVEGDGGTGTGEGGGREEIVSSHMNEDVVLSQPIFLNDISNTNTTNTSTTNKYSGSNEYPMKHSPTSLPPDIHLSTYASTTTNTTPTISSRKSPHSHLSTSHQLPTLSTHNLSNLSTAPSSSSSSTSSKQLVSSRQSLIPIYEPHLNLSNHNPSSSLAKISTKSSKDNPSRYSNHTPISSNNNSPPHSTISPNSPPSNHSSNNALNHLNYHMEELNGNTSSNQHLNELLNKGSKSSYKVSESNLSQKSHNFVSTTNLSTHDSCDSLDYYKLPVNPSSSAKLSSLYNSSENSLYMSNNQTHMINDETTTASSSSSSSGGNTSLRRSRLEQLNNKSAISGTTNTLYNNNNNNATDLDASINFNSTLGNPYSTSSNMNYINPPHSQAIHGQSHPHPAMTGINTVKSHLRKSKGDRKSHELLDSLSDKHRTSSLNSASTTMKINELNVEEERNSLSGLPLSRTISHDSPLLYINSINHPTYTQSHKDHKTNKLRHTPNQRDQGIKTPRMIPLDNNNNNTNTSLFSATKSIDSNQSLSPYNTLHLDLQGSSNISRVSPSSPEQPLSSRTLSPPQIMNLPPNHHNHPYHHHHIKGHHRRAKSTMSEDMLNYHSTKSYDEYTNTNTNNNDSSYFHTHLSPLPLISTKSNRDTPPLSRTQYKSLDTLNNNNITSQMTTIAMPQLISNTMTATTTERVSSPSYNTTTTTTTTATTTNLGMNQNMILTPATSTTVTNSTAASLPTEYTYGLTSHHSDDSLHYITNDLSHTSHKTNDISTTTTTNTTSATTTTDITQASTIINDPSSATSTTTTTATATTTANTVTSTSSLYEQEIKVDTQMRWKRGNLIGEGSFGKVYKGLNEKTGELLAVKQLYLSDSNDDDIKDIEEEISVICSLHHDNIVKYLGTTISDRHLFILLEYVPGGSVAGMLAQYGPFSDELLRRLSYQILLGIEYLHSKGIIHRDIKGSNVLVTDAGIAKLSDFGCSKQLAGLCTMSIEDHTKVIKGSVPWMAPEVIKQSGYGRSSDIWSFGATIIEMANGRPPWSEFTNNLAALFHVANSDHPPPFPENIGDIGHAFLFRCMSVDPKGRSTAKDLLQDIYFLPEINKLKRVQSI